MFRAKGRRGRPHLRRHPGSGLVGGSGELLGSPLVPFTLFLVQGSLIK